MAAAFEAPAAVDVISAPVVIPAAAESAPPPLVAALGPKVDAPKSSLKTVKSAKAAKPRNGKAGVVVQLGAYSSPKSVEAAWDLFAGRYGALRQYTPTSARFESSKGPVYRLSVKGFANLREASGLCSSLRSKGRACFVRRIAGDSPAEFASR